MAKTDDRPPHEMASSTPRDLHPTSDIRFVMTEVAALTERVGNLIERVSDIRSDHKEHLADIKADHKERFVEMKADGKETRERLDEVNRSIASFKGAMKVFGGLYALALVLVAAFLAWFLRPSEHSASSSADTVIAQKK